jgi:adenylate kinase
LVLLLFGPPGSGKGTQSRLITNWLGIPAISTGDMLRSEIQGGTKLGEAVRCIMTSGGLVGDDLVNEMLAHRVAQPDCLNGFLLDGYPRTVYQAEFLDRLIDKRSLPKPIILHLDVPLDALQGRLTSRRQCPKCGTIYNLLHQPPKKAGLCDNDGTPLITRRDDQEEVVRERLRTYEAQTRPVLAHYQDRKHYYQIRGDRSPQYIFEAITGIIEPMLSKNHAAK